MSAERLKRNMVQRRDGRMVNAGTRRGMLIVCANGCCCGRTERGYLPVPTDSVCGFPTEHEDARSLRHLASLLPVGGWLVFGINDWPFHLPEPRRDWRETGYGVELLEVLPYRAAMTCTDHTTLIWPDGRRERYELRRRHYAQPELRRLLEDTSFSLDVALHRLEGRPYGTGEDGLFVYARRTGR